MVTPWVPLLGERLAVRRARTRFRQLLLVGAAAVVDGVSCAPVFSSSHNGVVRVGVLVLALGLSYSMPVAYLWTWKISSDIVRVLSGQGLRVVKKPPLFSRRAYRRWLSRERLDEFDVMRRLAAPTAAGPNVSPDRF